MTLRVGGFHQSSDRNHAEGDRFLLETTECGVLSAELLMHSNAPTLVSPLTATLRNDLQAFAVSITMQGTRACYPPHGHYMQAFAVNKFSTLPSTNIDSWPRLEAIG